MLLGDGGTCCLTTQDQGCSKANAAWETEVPCALRPSSSGRSEAAAAWETVLCALRPSLAAPGVAADAAGMTDALCSLRASPRGGSEAIAVWETEVLCAFRPSPRDGGEDLQHAAQPAEAVTQAAENHIPWSKMSNNQCQSHQRREPAAPAWARDSESWLSLLRLIFV